MILHTLEFWVLTNGEPTIAKRIEGLTPEVAGHKGMLDDSLLPVGCVLVTRLRPNGVRGPVRAIGGFAGTVPETA